MTFPNKIIDYSHYYGIGEKADKSSDFLVGYGKTTIRKVYYADIPIGVLDFTTALTIPYGAAGMFDLYKDFKDYVGTLIDAIWNIYGKNAGIKFPIDTLKNTSGFEDNAWYFLQWNFPNPGEWEAIEEKLVNGKISFDWIMEEILYQKRILGNVKYNLPKNNAILEESKTSLKTKKEVEYEEYSYSKVNGLISTDRGLTLNGIYIKYGPFIISLTGNEEWANYWREDNATIFPNWENV